MVSEQRLHEIATQFFGLSPLPHHFIDALKECVNEGYRIGFTDGMIQQQMPDPFMEVHGG